LKNLPGPPADSLEISVGKFVESSQLFEKLFFSIKSYTYKYSLRSSTPENFQKHKGDMK